MEQKKYGCMHPFRTQMIDNDNGVYDIKPCCRAESIGSTDSVEKIKNHPSLINIRQAFLNGEKPSVCSSCFHTENAGKPSKRTDSLEDTWMNDSPVELDTELNLLSDITDWDIRTDYTCNLKCAMCNPYQSSKWHEDKEIWTKYFEGTITPRSGPDWNYILENTKNRARRIYLAGGEPFYSRQVIKFLEKLSQFEWNRENTVIWIQTNGVSTNRKLIQLCKKFKRMRFNFSVDALGDLNYIIRYPTDWTLFMKNYNITKKLFRIDNMNMSVTIGAMNLPEIDNLVNFFSDDRLSLNQLTFPEILSINALKPQVIDRVKKQTRLPVVKEMCNRYKYDGNLNERLQSYLSDLDYKRGTNSKLVMPWCFV